MTPGSDPVVGKTLLSRMYVYPIKSCSGSGVETARVRERTLEHDRRWMLFPTSLEGESRSGKMGGAG